MKKKLALLMAAIMTVAMVPMTAFASTKLTAVDEVRVATETNFTSRVELSKNDDQEDVTQTYKDSKYGIDVFDVKLKLQNGKFAKDDDTDEYLMNSDKSNSKGVIKVVVDNDTTATVTLNADIFNKKDGQAIKACVLDIEAYALEEGDVIATFSSNVPNFKEASEVIATAYGGDVNIESEGVVTFVEDANDDVKELKDITISSLVNGVIKPNTEITLKLNGNFKFVKADGTSVGKEGDIYNAKVSLLNDTFKGTIKVVDDEELVIKFNEAPSAVGTQRTVMTISKVYVAPTKSCDPGDVAKLTISSKAFDSVKLEVAKMVEEAVTYTVEDEDLPVIWAGKNYDKTGDTSNTLELSVEENTGDILNTSRKATFTFPEGIEVVGLKYDSKDFKEADFTYQIDENVVTIWNYSTGATESKDETDFGMKFLLNAAPTFSGDVKVTLGGEFDDVELTVATVKAPYTVEAKTSEVLIDYRYVPVNEIVITEAEEGLLEDDDVIVLAVEKMDFEDAGKYEVTSGDIEVKVNIDELDRTNYLTVEVEDESTEASTITISGLELYLDRTLPVGGYALQNVMLYDENGNAIHNNILWENSTSNDDEGNDAYNYVPGKKESSNGLFKYKEITVNDSYVEVVTAGRDQDDSSTTRKIVITIGATTMAVGTETVTLDAPAYINSDNYTMLPLRAVSEAFGATVGWDDASRTVTLMMGQRIVSMTIGSKTMYINGTPVAMNTAPEIVSERTFLPVRDLCNALGITKIDWNEASATVTLN